MKKVFTYTLLFLSLGLFASCWNKSSKASDSDAKDSSLVQPDVIYPTTPSQEEGDHKATGSAEMISSKSKEILLFDAPLSTQYIQSSARQLLQDKILKFGNGNEGSVMLGLDHPNGVRVLAQRNGIGQNLINDVPDDYFFDDYGDLNPAFSVEVALLDVNKDNSSEIAVAVGKPGDRIDLSLFALQKTPNGAFVYLGTIQSKSVITFADGVFRATAKDNSKLTYKLQDNKLVLVH